MNIQSRQIVGIVLLATRRFHSAFTAVYRPPNRTFVQPALQIFHNAAVFKRNECNAEKTRRRSHAKSSCIFLTFHADNGNGAKSRYVNDRTERVRAIIGRIQVISPMVAFPVSDSMPDRLADFSGSILFSHFIRSRHIAIIFAERINLARFFHRLDEFHGFFHRLTRQHFRIYV